MKENVLGFLSDLHKLTKNGASDSEINFPELLKTYGLTVNHKRAILNSKIIEPFKGKTSDPSYIWNTKFKPDKDLESHILNYTLYIKDNFKSKGTSKIIQKLELLMKEIYSDTNKGKVSLTATELHLDDRLKKYNLKNFRFIIMNNILSEKIVFINMKPHKAWEWKFDKPSVDSATKIHDMFINMKGNVSKGRKHIGTINDFTTRKT